MGLSTPLCEIPLILVAIITLLNLVIFHQGDVQLQHMKNLAEEVGVQQHNLSKRGRSSWFDYLSESRRPQTTRRASSIIETFRSLDSTDEDSTETSTASTSAYTSTAYTSITSISTLNRDAQKRKSRKSTRSRQQSKNKVSGSNEWSSRSNERTVRTENLYIRYGKHTCSSHTQAGALSLTGSHGFVAGLKSPGVLTSSNLICLPARPRISGTTSTQESVSTSKSVVPVIFKTEPLISASVEAKDGVLKCVMCKSSRSVVAMFPGINTCYDGWFFEYKGWLISSHKENPRDSIDLTCVDSNVDVYPTANYSKRNHILVTFAHMGACGIDGVCDSYSADQLIPCIVCSI